jgi:prepilin-type N-terminal cleavage/methylation domain-containing protein
MTPRRRAGFTLIELLTVIAIIGILSAALFPAIRGVRKKAQQSSATTAFTQWAGGVTRYKQVYGFYPNIGTAYDSSKDSLHLLEDPETNLMFVKAMSGRLPTGTALPTPDPRPPSPALRHLSSGYPYLLSANSYLLSVLNFNLNEPSSPTSCLTKTPPTVPAKFSHVGPEKLLNLVMTSQEVKMETSFKVLKDQAFFQADARLIKLGR